MVYSTPNMAEGSNLIFWYQNIFQPLVPFHISKILRTFQMG